MLLNQIVPYDCDAAHLANPSRIGEDMRIIILPGRHAGGTSTPPPNSAIDHQTLAGPELLTNSSNTTSHIADNFEVTAPQQHLPMTIKRHISDRPTGELGIYDPSQWSLC